MFRAFSSLALAALVAAALQMMSFCLFDQKREETQERANFHEAGSALMFLQVLVPRSLPFVLRLLFHTAFSCRKKGRKDGLKTSPGFFGSKFFFQPHIDLLSPPKKTGLRRHKYQPPLDEELRDIKRAGPEVARGDLRNGAPPEAFFS
jgi:hypothetical protein